MKPVTVGRPQGLWLQERRSISGKSPACPAGTVPALFFFSGCNLRCVYCQNHKIAQGHTGQDITASRLSDIFLELQEKGAHNVNLVTPSHFVPQIIIALQSAKKQGLFIPVVYNSSAYEKVETLRELEGLVDIYLPDLKYFDPVLSESYSNAPDYFETASAAIAEMVRQVGAPVFADGEDSLMLRGVIVRHLLLPGCGKDSRRILRFLHETFKNDIYVSIMNQYTPLSQVSSIPSLNRRISTKNMSESLTSPSVLALKMALSRREKPVWKVLFPLSTMRDFNMPCALPFTPFRCHREKRRRQAPCTPPKSCSQLYFPKIITKLTRFRLSALTLERLETEH